VTVEQISSAGEHDNLAVDVAGLTATILTAVERQLSRYFSAMTQRVDAALATAETLRAEVRTELSGHIPQLEKSLEGQRVATEAYQQVLRAALDERLADVAARSTARLNDLDIRLAAVAAQPTGVTPEDLRQIRQSMREDIRESLAPVTEHLDLVADTTRRTSELAHTLAEQVESTSVRAAVSEERFTLLRSTSDARMTGLEQRLSSASAELAAVSAKMAGIDQDAIEDLKRQMSAAIGEAMLVRIELDRVRSAMDDKLDRTTVRLGEIEAKLSDEMDVGAAVQLERLDELERAVALLDPDQFVRREPTGAGQGPHGTPGSGAREGGTDHNSSDDTNSSDALSSSEAWS
jgi:hypothetical protein